MAAPSGISWGSTVNSKGRIGIYTSVTNTSATQSKVSVEIWFWSKWSVTDSNNRCFYDNEAKSATTNHGSVSINHTVSSGDGWSTSNQTKIKTFSTTYTRKTSAQTKYFAAKLSDIDAVGGSMTETVSYTIPSLDVYKITYNSNGGSGASGVQNKYYGINVTLSPNKPTRTGYSFLGWATSSTATSATYAAGATYSANASVTLYAVWKANTYTVSFNANGGTGAPGAQTKTYGVTLTLSSTKPTRTNYNFKGWGMSAGSTTVSYAAGGNYTNNSSITLYAIWELAYTKPRITNLKVTRVDSAGNASDGGPKYRVQYSWATDKENPTRLHVVKNSSGTQVDTSGNMASSGTSGTVNSVSTYSGLASEQSYTIHVTVTDSSGSTTVSATIPAMTFLIDFKSEGKGVAIGKPSTVDNLFDVNWNTKVHGTITSTSDMYIQMGSANYPNGMRVRAKRCVVGNMNNSTSTNRWHKFASVSLTSNYDRRISFLVTHGWSNTTKFGLLHAYARADANGNFNNGKLILDSESDLSTDNFVLAYNGPNVELWVNVPSNYTLCHFEVISESSRDGFLYNDWILYYHNDVDGVAGPTSGYTQIVASRPNLKVQTQLLVGTKLNLYESSEGGNIQFKAPDSYGNYYELDASDGNARLYTFDTSNNFKAFYFNRNGTFKCTGGITGYLPTTGGTINGYTWINNTVAAIGQMRLHTDYINFYRSSANANSNTDRVGWLGFGGGTNDMSFMNVTGSAGKNVSNKTWTISSDSRLKKDIENIPKVFIDIWKELQPKVFKWNELNGGGDTIQFGLIAQDVISAFEKRNLDYREYSLVSSTKMFRDGKEYFCIAYDAYHMLTSLVLKETNERLDSLQAQVDELKVAISALTK